MDYAYDTTQFQDMWDAPVVNPNDPFIGFLALHTELNAANNAYYRTDGGPHCPISASGW